MKKRSNAPVFWLLFGAGGMLSALFGGAMVFVSGIAAPLGWMGAGFMDYPRMLAFSQQWFAKGFLFAAVMLFAWHAVHRIYHSLHDLGLRTGAPAKLACYGTALVITLISAAALLAIGF
ncbi:fumarate reductase subunit FrdD [Caenimonas terrae]|uniref:Fumarate reductase subunit FrdD n=1 Tax=Caenimonas terrae TaxID=696074 RepID=A0ABW0NJB0_9BURK